MTTTSYRAQFAKLRSTLLLACALGSSGCTYLEAQMQRTRAPDERIRLGWQDRVSLYPGELGNYTCEERYYLVCERAGVTYTCTCAPN